MGDLPFLSYHTGIYDSVRNAGRLVQEGGCKAVKLEGGREIVENVKAIINAGIPVMGHLGIPPSQLIYLGGINPREKHLKWQKKYTRMPLFFRRQVCFQ